MVTVSSIVLTQGPRVARFLGDRREYTIDLGRDADLAEMADGYYEFVGRQTRFIASKAQGSEDGLVHLNDGGLVANQTPINSIFNIEITFDPVTFNSAVLFIGNSFLSFDHSVSLDVENSISEYENKEIAIIISIIMIFIFMIKKLFKKN